MKVEIFSDVACPFCYIGTRQFAEALEGVEGHEQVEVVWRSFQLDPEAPRRAEGDLYDHLSRKFGISRDEALAMNDRVISMGHGAGVEFDFENARAVNTFDAHRMLKLAAEQGVDGPLADAFFAAYFTGSADLSDPADLARLPFTTKADLAADQLAHPPYGSNLSFPLDRYSRLHQTSGTSTGRPLRWLDTPESWDAVLRCWQISFPLMGLTPQDRVYFPFSFGPFIGFWSAFEAAARYGALVLPGGGMPSTARLRFLVEHAATVVFATPTYALHLAELAAKERIDLAGSTVRMLVVAGEPGGTIASTRKRIEDVWGARVIDHYGMTEIGPVAVEAADTPGEMLLLETEYIAEILTPNGGDPVPDGEEVVQSGIHLTQCVRAEPGVLGQIAAPTGTDHLLVQAGAGLQPGDFRGRYPLPVSQRSPAAPATLDTGQGRPRR